MQWTGGRRVWFHALEENGSIDPGVLRSAQIDIHTFAPTDCAVVEGMATAGTRKMLLFSTVTNNIGPGALFLGPPRLRVAS